MRGFLRVLAEAERKRHFVGLGEIDLANQGDVAVLRRVQIGSSLPLRESICQPSE